MFLAGILSWWYTDGLFGRVQMIKKRLAGVADFFSIGLLIKTLFQPFRQISAGSLGGSLADQMSGLLDKAVSRCIGAAVRTVMIVIGLMTIIISLALYAIFLLVWIVMPFLPVIGLVLVVIGWVPS